MILGLADYLLGPIAAPVNGKDRVVNDKRMASPPEVVDLLLLTAKIAPQGYGKLHIFR